MTCAPTTLLTSASGFRTCPAVDIWLAHEMGLKPPGVCGSGYALKKPWRYPPLTTRAALCPN